MPRHHEAMETHKVLFDWLKNEGFDVLVEKDLAGCLPYAQEHFATVDKICQKIDLAIVIGGDGNMLRAARLLCRHNIKVIGVNRGNLGFLTDIIAEQAKEQLKEVLSGKYINDPRFLLEVLVYEKEEEIASGIAINEIVVHPSQVAHMVNYDAYINDHTAFSQCADGLIIATPTGSTAYSLSAGGPIIAPALDALIITPMFPHSLSVRPLVIKSDSVIRLSFPTRDSHLEIACDSQVSIPVKSNHEIVIRRSPYEFHLIHSGEYDYFQNLSLKLGWSKKMY